MQATYIQVGREIDYTPVAAVEAGQVVVQANLVGVATADIAAGKLGSLAVSGIFDVDQNAEIIPAGAPVYWDADGTSVSGTGGAGAATAGARRVVRQSRRRGSGRARGRARLPPPRRC